MILSGISKKHSIVNFKQMIEYLHFNCYSIWQHKVTVSSSTYKLIKKVSLLIQGKCSTDVLVYDVGNLLCHIGMSLLLL